MELALACDSLRSDADHLARNPDLTRIGNGVYAAGRDWARASAQARHIARIYAVRASARGELVLLGVSAALWLGLPVVGRIPEEVQCLGEHGERGRTSLLRRHERHGLLDPITIGGLHVTRVADTVIDLTRWGGLVQGVCAMDAALAQRRLTFEELDDAVVRLAHGARGVRCVRKAVRIADGRSESPGESLSRVRMWQEGLPRPELQHEIEVDGRVIRVDFFWPTIPVAGEFDGLVKYRRESFGRQSEETVWQERQRERLITGQGIDVVRWTWNQAWRDMGAGMCRELARGGVHPMGYRW